MNIKVFQHLKTWSRTGQHSFNKRLSGFCTRLTVIFIYCGVTWL
jgi:hypothetical protein